jgi:uncharacterized membrane protein YhhN
VETSKFANGLMRASLIAGLTYFLSWQMELTPVLSVTWKGAGVALLALYAARLARSLDGWLIAGVMAFGALGDVLLDAVGLDVGAVAFVVGHLIAVVLYFRNRRPSVTPSQRWLAAVTVPSSLYISYALTSDVMIAIYTVFVAGMAAMAWISRFPRYQTGIGAMMFLASDLLIFARMGPLETQPWASYAIWGLYFGGQMLIVRGVTQTLARD